jgi:hypothetical protein
MRIASAVVVGAAAIAASTTGGSHTTASHGSSPASAHGSSSPHPTKSSTAAMAACVHAFGPRVGSASRTTVGDVRRSGGGPPMTDGSVNMPAATAFGDEPNSATAYWCWVGHDGDWTLYGIDAYGARVAMYEEYDDSQPFPAPPAPDGAAFWL